MSAGEYHLPAMPEQTLGLLELKPGDLAVDATVGGGGHAGLILSATAPDGILIGIDRDAEAIEEARGSLGWAGERVKLVCSRMGELTSVLKDLNIEGVDAALADLGVSSHQLDESARGFSIKRDGPLDMRMGSEGRTAAELIAESGAEELERMFRDYGEERYSGRIARAIAGRDDIDTTAKLAGIVVSTIPKGRRARIHPATRVFQALRIAVNDELGELGRFLDTAPGFLRPGGRLAILSYHSLEDRMVKRRFRELAAEGDFELLVKRPLTAGDEEVRGNPRARSAKLRALKRRLKR